MSIQGSGRYGVIKSERINFFNSVLNFLPPIACSCQRIRVSGPEKVHAASLGFYTLQTCEFASRAVYKHDLRDIYLYYTNDSTWAFGLAIDQVGAFYRSAIGQIGAFYVDLFIGHNTSAIGLLIDQVKDIYRPIHRLQHMGQRTGHRPSRGFP